MEEDKKQEEFTRDTKLNIHQRINAVMADVDYLKKGKTIKVGGGSYSVTGHDAVTALSIPF